MKSILSIAFFAFYSFACVAEEVPRMQEEYDSTKWPEAHLKLSQAGTLKDLFDSGLRPYRFPGLERSTLEVKHLRLVVHLSSGKILPEIPMEWINIAMFSDGELAHLEGATPKLTLDQARAEMLKWLPFGTNGRTKLDLESYLKAAEADFLDFDDPYRGRPDGCSVKWEEPGYLSRGGGAGCDVWFRKTASTTHPLSLYIKFSWGPNRKMKDAKGYTTPIPPPPGYEHASMDAPKNFGPDSAYNILKSQGYNVGDGQGGRPLPDQLITSPRKPAPATPLPPIEKPASVPWWAITGGIVVLLAAAMIAWRRKRAHAP